MKCDSLIMKCFLCPFALIPCPQVKNKDNRQKNVMPQYLPVSPLKILTHCQPETSICQHIKC